MKGQWGLLFAFIFALIVAIFAVINVDAVTVDYLFGTAQWPLVLVILASALLGALIVGGFGIFRMFRLRRENRNLHRENQQLAEELQKFKPEPLENEEPAKLEEAPVAELGGASLDSKAQEKATESDNTTEQTDDEKENPRQS